MNRDVPTGDAPSCLARAAAGSVRLLLALFAAMLVTAPAGAAAGESQRPRLIVQITLDQLRADLLERYRPAFAHGLRRLLEDGYWIRRGEVAHGLTVSFPGHATLATGLHPARHGLTANEWWAQRDGRWASIDVVEDAGTHMLGEPGRVGVSPRNLVGSAIADWVKEADPAARTVALSTGATIAIAYGGRRPDAAYWFDGSVGRFTTSTYYRSAPHDWLDRFNREGLPAFQAPVWALTVPARFRPLASPDAEPFEASGANNVFPHEFAAESRTRPADEPLSYGRWFAATPLKDEALLALAARAVDAERLGQRGHVDYLAVLLDSTDTIGHRFGPSSLEQLDTLLRIDAALGRFLDHLDTVVGRGRYVVALSADHGVADPPEQIGARRVTGAEIEALLDRIEARAVTWTGTEAALIEAIAAELARTDFIAAVYSATGLARDTGDPYAALYRNSLRPGHTTDFPLWTRRERAHHPARYGLFVRFAAPIVFDRATAVHGSPYAYDRSVPILFYGTGVTPGQQGAGGRTVDVAPTLAAAAGIPVPPDRDGAVLMIRQGEQP